MKEQDCFDGTQTFKLRIFIQSFQLILHNYQDNLSEDRKKFLYSTAFHIGRAGKWIEPHLSNLTNLDPAYLLNNCALFDYQLFTLFGDPNEVRKSEAELDALRMKEGGHVLLYLTHLRSLVSNIGDWGETAHMHHYRKGLAFRIWYKFASHPSIIDLIKGLMDFILEHDTRYHERQKENSNFEKKPEVLWELLLCGMKMRKYREGEITGK
ncbi:hypothetical protein O181_013268 [Austropuccinia psidii MF-1]|uniref:Retrotransposon gag domain-containing protein n=1 Tax=Austropuccinia psidii MF-1 TaxID=1389203 RepID=A0A9Q3BYD0_9BASI|nr:hypothetical protein [Austropuccinia psidii MF-1]